MSLVPTTARSVAKVALLLVVISVAGAIWMASDAAEAQQITSDTTFRDETLVFSEDVEVTNGAKLTLVGCDVTFRPPGSAPLFLTVSSGSLEVSSTDMVGEGAGFIVVSYGDSIIRNVTASGLGAVANSSLSSRGLPMTAHGGFMFYGKKLTVFNLDVSGAPATALYAQDCDVDIYSLGVRDACGAFTGTDQCAAVAIVYLGHPQSGSSQRVAVINGSMVQSSKNHGLLVAAASTGYDARVSIKGTEVSTSGASGLVVYEVGSHERLEVTGDTNELHHSKANGLLWVRDGASGLPSSLKLEESRIYSNEGNAFTVVTRNSKDAADLELKSCTVTDTMGSGAYVTATGCTQTLNVTLRGCALTSCGGYGLYFATDGDGKTSEYHMRLVDTVVEDSGSKGIHTKVSQSYCRFNLTLEGSAVTGSASDGIHMEYSLTYFSYTEAPSVTSNLTVDGSLIADNRGYGIYDSRYLKSYYYWAQAKATHYAAVNIRDSVVRNHTKSAVIVVPTSQFQYTTYTTEAYLIDSTFVNNSGYGYFERVDSLTQANGGSTRVNWHVRGCAFRQLASSGVYIELRRADSTRLNFDVLNCTFSELGGRGASLYAHSTPYAGSVVARLVDCEFTDLAKRAYYLWPGRPGSTGGDQRVLLRRVTAHNTTGIRIDLDGYATEDYYRLVLDDVNITHTRGDAVHVTVHPYQSARMDTVVRDVYARDTNGTAFTLSYTSDRSQNLWGSLTGSGITLLDQVAGMLLQEHTGRIDGLTIKGSVDFDLHKVDNRVPPDETGILELHSAFMDRHKVRVVGSGSLWVFNELHVKVEWQNGMAALGAGVQVQDRTFQVVAVGHVDGEHGMDPVELLAYILDSSEFRSRSPFIVNITFLDLEQTGVCSLDEPAVVRIVVHDRVAPSVVVLEPDDGAAQRASYFELRGSAFDAHAGLHEIRYSLDEGNWTVVGKTSPFRTTVEGVGPGQHILEVQVEDRAGNVQREVIRLEIDNQPPRLVIASPEGDMLTREPTLIVRGETEDGATVSINGLDVETLHGLFIAEVQLQEGPNTVTVVSMDRLSNVATVRFIATLDTVEPFLDVQSHEDGDWVGRSDVTIRGMVETGCVLTVNGREVSVDNQSFEALVSLKVGDNTVLVRAVDPAGNVYTEKLTLFVATEPPWLHLESPEDGAIFDVREVRVLGTVQPGSVVTLNGRLVTIKQGLIDELLILPEGQSTITIEAMDPAGNILSVARQVTVDTVDPVISVDALPRRTREPTLTVSGTVEGAVSLVLDGVAVQISTDGSFSVNVTLTEGKNTLGLVALDGVGHEDRATVQVELDSTAPFIRVLLPGLSQDGNRTYVSREGTATVHVVSEPGTSITLNDLFIIVGDDGTATVDIPLGDEGTTTTVRVVAVDDLGNTHEEVLELRHEPTSIVGSSMEWGGLLSTALVVALLVAMVVLVARYQKLVKEASRPRRGRRPTNGRRPNGGPKSGQNGGDVR